MHKGIIIYNDGAILNMNPRFVQGDPSTRKFAKEASDAIHHEGIALSIGYNTSVQRIDDAIGILLGVREKQIAAEQMFGRIPLDDGIGSDLLM